MKMWQLQITDTEDWFFSTKDLVEKAVKFFQLEDDEYDIFEVSVCDDEELLKRIDNLSEEEKKKRGL